MGSFSEHWVFKVCLCFSILVLLLNGTPCGQTTCHSATRQLMGHLGCFDLLTVVKTVAVNTCVGAV